MTAEHCVRGRVIPSDLFMPDHTKEIVTRLVRAVRRLAYNDAEDVVQDLMVEQIVRRIHPTTWLAKRRAIDKLRRQARERRALETLRVVCPKYYTDAKPDVIEEVNVLIKHCGNMLTPRQRSIIHSVFYLEQDYVTIGRSIGLSKSMVASELRSALRVLRFVKESLS